LYSFFERFEKGLKFRNSNRKKAARIALTKQNRYGSIKKLRSFIYLYFG